MTHERRDAAPQDPVVAAWIATVVDIPLYTVIGSACAYVGAQVWERLSGASGAPVETVDDTETAVVTATALIVIAGIVLVAHTVGRWLHVATARESTRRAAGAFATMGAILGLVPAAIVVAMSGEPEAVVFVLIAIVVPCALVASLTRFLLPRVAAADGAVIGFAIVAVICVLLATTMLGLIWVTWPGVGQGD